MREGRARLSTRKARGRRKGIRLIFRNDVRSRQITKIERQRPRLWKHIHRGAGRRPHESREESSFLFNELLHLIVRRAARNVHHAAKRVRARQSGDCFESCCAARKSRARERSASRPVRSWGSVKSPAFEKIKYNTRVADVSHTSVYRNPHQVSKVSSL